MKMNLVPTDIQTAISLMKKTVMNSLDKNTTPQNVFMHGSMGIGKSSAVQQLAEELSRELDIMVKIIDIRLSAMEASDVQGIPYTAAAGKITTINKDGTEVEIIEKEMFFSTPHWWPKDDGCLYIVFVDELTNASKSVQQASYRLILDRSCQSGVELPKSTFIVGAGNMKEDGTGAKELLPALANRFGIHLLIDKDKVAQSFIPWAMNSGRFNVDIISFLNFKKDRICTEANNGPAFGTPRSWENASDNYINPFFDDFEKEVAMAGAIGCENAADFTAYTRYKEHHPDWDEVRRTGEYILLAVSDDITWSITTPLAFEILKDLKKDNTQNVENLCTVLEQLSTEFKIVFFKTLKYDKDVAMKFFGISKLFDQYKLIKDRL